LLWGKFAIATEFDTARVFRRAARVGRYPYTSGLEACALWNPNLMQPYVERLARMPAGRVELAAMIRFSA
jgi:hypothetical protein